MMKRVFLFLAVNFLVIAMVSIVLNVLGVRPYLDANGIDYNSLLIFCLVWGMGGAFVSLALSRVMAKWMMGVKVIDSSVSEPALQNLIQTISHLSRSAGIPMPEVGIYQSPEVNAFATGPSRNRSLVAVSTGLLQRMNQSELEGVLGHEIAHIANGDMVTMTLVQGVVNAFVMFLARVIAFAIMTMGRRDDRGAEGMSYFAYHLTVFALEMVFMILGSMVVAAFSRYREFRADAGSARIAGREKMIGALEALRRTYDVVDPQLEGNAAVKALKISNRSSGIGRFFSTHPPLEERIARLRAAY